MTALVGPSGSGKSTLLNCIGLLESVDEGNIFFGDREITRLSAAGSRKFRRDELGYLFQNYALIENATVAENLDVANRARRGFLSRRRADYEEILGRVGLAGRSKEKVHFLSGGEQQRVALARLLVKRPSVVLADEPTGALDEANSRMVVDLLGEMAENGCAVVIATHDAKVRDSCHRAFSVDSGHMRDISSIDYFA